MAYQTAKGNGPSTGTPKTPAPTRPAAPDVISRIRAPSTLGYGMNDALNPASIDPGQQLLSPLAENLKASGDDGEGMLDRVIARGTAKGTAADVELQSPQTRAVDDTPLPTAFGMRNRSGEGAKVPATTGASEFDPASVRKPGGN